MVSAQSQTPQGSGTENDPYLITSLQDLEWINIEGEFDKHYKQTKNIDLKGASYRDDDTFIPLGNLGNKGNRKNTTDNLQEFTGTYDGNNKSILHLSSNPGGNLVGFIGNLGQGGVLKDLAFVRARVSGGHSTGIAVGNNNGTVERVGIAGGEVEHVVNDNDFANTGGLVGRNNQYGKIKNSSSTATVIGYGKQIGGLVGVNRPGGVIEGSSAFASVTNKDRTNVNDRTGGLVGSNGGKISFSYAVDRTDIQVTGEHAVGGLVGRNAGTIYYCFARVDVDGETYVGGLVGAAVNKEDGDDPLVTATYATGNVSGTDYVGGLLGGGKSGKESSGKVELSYSTGRVTGIGNNVGGFAGSDVNKKASNYWNTETSDQNSSAFGQPKTDAEMYDESNFTSRFKGVFKWQNGVYKSFPYFKSVFTYDRTDRETQLPNIPGQVFNNGSMVIVIDTDYSSEATMSLPLMQGVNLQIDWGDGTLKDVSSAGVVEHTYDELSTGEKVIRLNGSLKTFGDWTQSYDGAKMIKSINRWGDLGITEFKSAFKGASNLTSVPNSLPTEVTTIQGMFTDATSFNDANISSWDVSNVTRMSRLFRGASSFNQDISDWDVSNVTGFGLTFLDASSFNQDITEWDVSSATHMNEMFRNATDFDQDLSAWDVSSVTNMSYMFQGASNFDNGGEPLTWTTSGSLLNIRNMFKDAVAFNQQVGSWDVSNVTNMQAVFNGASSFNRELKNWDVAKVENMQFMFGPGNKQMVFNKDISGWDVSSVTKMNGMFRGANEFNQDIGEWDVSEVEQMNKMFEGADAFNQDISGWTVSNVLTMESMFKYATSFNQNLGNWSISGVTNMEAMFKGTALSTQNYSNTLIGWAKQSGLQSGVKLGSDAKFTPEAKSSRSKLINEYDWNISDGGELGSESFPTVSSPNVSDITSNAATFSASVTDSGDSATRGHGFVWSSESKTPKLNDNTVREVYLIDDPKSFSWTETDLSVNTQYWVRSYATNDEGTSYGEDVVTFSTTPELSSDFSLASNGVTVLCPDAEVGDVGEVNGVRYTKRTADQITASNAASTCTSGITDMQGLFQSSDINDDISHWDVSSVEDMGLMFEGATSFNQDLSHWDVSSVRSLGDMFKDATSFNQDISDWDVSSVQLMNGMFEGASEFNQDIGEWDVSSVLFTNKMFQEASSFNQNLSQWDMKNVIGTDFMFQGATAFNNGGAALTWEFSSNLNSIRNMFKNARSFNQTVNSWNVSEVYNMQAVFNGADSFNQPLDQWDVGSVTNMSYMFGPSSGYPTTFNQDISGWDVSNVTNMEHMFRGNTAFNQDIGDWDVAKVTKMSRMFFETTQFNQDLQQWCVTEIKAYPADFAASSSLSTEHLPQWGQCPVSRVTLRSPAHEAANQPLSQTLSWASDARAESYTLEVSTDNFESTLVSEDLGATDTTYALSDLAYETTYEWHVRAANTMGIGHTGEWSDTRSFTTRSAPTPDQPGRPTLSSPTDGATGQSTSLTVNWDEAARATSYTVQVSDDNFASLDAEETVSGTSASITGLAFETTYKWRVIGNNQAGQGDWSPSWSFSTEGSPAPGRVTLSSPADGATGQSYQPTLSWQSVPYASTYQVQVSANGFSTTLVDQNTSSTKLQVSVDFNSSYEWRVRASNTAGVGAWSEARSFSTRDVPPPGQVSLTSPSNGATGLTMPVSLQWEANQYASSYVIEIANGEEDDQTTTSTTNSVDVTLEYETTYTWRVKSKNSNGESSWSESWSFSTAEGVVDSISTMSPADGATNQSTSPTLTWEADPNATEYDVEVSDDDFASTMLSKTVYDQTSYRLSGLDNEASYSWRVRASNNTSDGPWSEISSFTTRAPSVSMPLVVEPSQNAQDVEIPTVFTWEGGENATSYEIELFTDALLTTVFSFDVTDTTYTYEEMEAQKDYLFRVRAKNASGTSNWSNVEFKTGDADEVGTSNESWGEGLPQRFGLEQNYPNPFNPSTVIRYAVPQASQVRLIVFDMMGREVATLVQGTKSAGYHEVVFDASHLGSGAYMYRLEAGDVVLARTLYLIK